MLALDRIGRYREAEMELDGLPPGTEKSEGLVWYSRAFAEAGLGRLSSSLVSLKRAAEIDPGQFSLGYQMALQAQDEADLKKLFGIPTPPPRPKSLPLALVCLAAGAALGAGGLWLGLRMRLGLFRGRENEIPTDTVMLGAFRVARKIGVGGMGTVYEAWDMTLQRAVALKMMHPRIRFDPHERERFLKEARTVAALLHPNIVQIYSIVENSVELCIVFEYVKGRTLEEVLDQHGPLSYSQALEILRGACEGLEYAHARNVIHRDVKLSNIMIAKDGTVKLMDFGLARTLRDPVKGLSMTRTNCGTPPYMAPEIERGIIDKEADVYALAVCFYELLSGRLPFSGEPAMSADKMNLRYPTLSTLVANLPVGVDDILRKALQPDPARRTRAPMELYTALAELAKDEALAARGA